MNCCLSLSSDSILLSIIYTLCPMCMLRIHTFWICILRIHCRLLNNKNLLSILSIELNYIECNMVLSLNIVCMYCRLYANNTLRRNLCSNLKNCMCYNFFHICSIDYQFDWGNNDRYIFDKMLCFSNLHKGMDKTDKFHLLLRTFVKRNRNRIQLHCRLDIHRNTQCKYRK